MVPKPPTYLDSSAILKLVAAEPESAALRSHLHGRRPLVSSAIARTEVRRAALAVGDFVVRRAVLTLSHLELVRVSDQVLDVAAELEPVDLGTTDAIHLATASIIAGDGRAVFVTYDQRLGAAAEDLGLSVLAPT